MHKQMDLPIAYSNVHIPQLRRNTVKKDMPQWYQDDHASMPDWFELRKLLDKAEPLNLFRRSESGSLTRFQHEQYRSKSTEPEFGRARHAQTNPFYRIPDDSSAVPRRTHVRTSFEEETDCSANSRRANGGQESPLGQKMPFLRDLDNMSSVQLAKEMEKRDQEMMSRISQAAATMSSTRPKGKDPPLKTLVCGSLMSPMDTFLAKQSLACTLPKQPPFGIETLQADPAIDPPPVICEEPVNPNKAAQFAWWSSHWADLTAQKQRGLEAEQASRPKPIKPVRNFWKGNFQKRPVPWRKEQLGAFPSYKDFPWPPPVRAEDTKKKDAALASFLNASVPWGDDRGRFLGPSEASMSRLTYPADRDTRQCPDFTDKRSDLSNSMTTLPDGKAWRPRSLLGWAGYKQTRTDKQYDPFSRRMFADAVDKMLGITADKLVQCGVPPSAGNFLLAFAHFEPSLGTHSDPIPKTGYLSWAQFQVALQHFGAVFTEKDERDLFEAFATAQSDGERKVHVWTFVEAIEDRGLCHPLGFPYD